MNKAVFLFTIIAIISFATLVVLIITRFGKTSQNTPTNPVALPTKNIPLLPTGATIESSGVKVNNPFINAKDYTIRGDALTTDTETYSIVYLKDFDEFIISIKTEPFDQNREVAEEEFLRRLGITQIEACNLKVSVMPPINKNELTQKYRLSFCE